MGKWADGPLGTCEFLVWFGLVSRAILATYVQIRTSRQSVWLWDTLNYKNGEKPQISLVRYQQSVNHCLTYLWFEYSREYLPCC